MVFYVDYGEAQASRDEDLLDNEMIPDFSNDAIQVHSERSAIVTRAASVVVISLAVVSGLGSP